MSISFCVRFIVAVIRKLEQCDFNIYVPLCEPPHDKSSKMACAPSEDTDQPGHPPSLISLCCPHEETLGP